MEIHYADGCTTMSYNRVRCTVSCCTTRTQSEQNVNCSLTCSLTKEYRTLTISVIQQSNTAGLMQLEPRSVCRHCNDEGFFPFLTRYKYASVYRELRTIISPDDVNLLIIELLLNTRKPTCNSLQVLNCETYEFHFDEVVGVRGCLKHSALNALNVLRQLNFLKLTWNKCTWCYCYAMQTFSRNRVNVKVLRVR